MNALFLTWLTRGIVGGVILGTLWLANATDEARRVPSLFSLSDRLVVAALEIVAPTQR